MNTKYRYAIIGLLITSLVSIGISGVVTAQTKPAAIIESSTEYPISEDSQAIRVTLSVSPPKEQISNTSLNIRNSQQAFIDFDSFSVTLKPSGATEITESIQMQRGEKVKKFFIKSLRPDETVTIQFRVYPRTLKTTDKTITAAIVRYHYLSNGVEVPGNQPGKLTVKADISNSPVYQYQSTKMQLKGMWAITGIGVLAGVAGLGIGAYTFFQNRNGSSRPVSSGEIRSARRKLKNVRAKIDARGGEDDIIKEIDEIRDRLEE